MISIPLINKQVRLASSPEGLPEPGHFRIVEQNVPQVEEGEILCRNLWLSLDPYMRSQIAGRHLSGSVGPGDLLQGETIAKVVFTRDPNFREGQEVRGFGGWQEYAIFKSEAVSPLPAELPEARWALGSLGMPGLTAWAGLTRHVSLQPGQTLLLPAATGAVGSIAAGIARHYGVRVVGIVGSAEKQAYALKELGVSACINRLDPAPEERLKEACPEGIDVYLDLVGGRWLQLAAEHLATGGHIILCGLMAEYNHKERSAGPAPGLILRARGHISGLVVHDYENQRDEFIRWCHPLIARGEIRFREDITQGLENAPEAFCQLMRGENFGKVLVQLTA